MMKSLFYMLVELKKCSDMVPEGIDYVALGHLHRYHHIEGGPCPIVYSGSPLAYSMSEDNQEKHVVIIEKDLLSQVSTKSIPLTKGRRCFKTKSRFH